MTNQQSTELTEPCVGALVVFAVRDGEVDAALLEPLSQWIGVVDAVGDHAFWLRSRSAFGARDLDCGERGFRLKATGHQEAIELEATHQQLMQKAEEALRNLISFEKSQLSMDKSNEDF